MRLFNPLLALCLSVAMLSGCALQTGSVVYEDSATEFRTMDPMTAIDELMEISSTNRLFTGVDHWMVGRIQARFENVSEITLMPIFESAMENFSEDILMAGAKMSVAQHYHSQYMSQLISWYRSDLGMAYSQRSVPVDTSSAEFTHWFEVVEFDTEYAQLVRRLMEVSQVLDMVETRMMVPYEGMRVGWQQATRRAGVTTRIRQEEPLGAQVAKAQNIAVMCAMFAYRDLDVDALRSIIAFEESSPARWYYGVVHSGIQAALFQASRRMSEGITRSVMMRVEREMSKT